MQTPFSDQPAHLVKRFQEQEHLRPDKALFFEKVDGMWRGISYSQAETMIACLANYLLSLGLKPGEHVVLCGDNSPRWAVADLAIMTIGCVVVPAYTTNTQDDHEYILSHSEARLVICQGKNKKVAEVLLRALEKQDRISDVVFLDQPDKKLILPQGISVHVLEGIMAQSSSKDGLDGVLHDTEEDTPCCLIYTSGTGGRPKGVLLTHKSIQANIDAARVLLVEGGVRENAVFLSLLPLSHAYEHTAGLHLPIQIGAEIWYCEGPEKITTNFIEARPTVMTAVPRLYEVLHDRITKGVNARGGLSARLFWQAVRLGRKKLDNRKLSLVEMIQDKLLDRLVRKKVQQRFGGRLAYFVSGGAALSSDIGSFFLSLGVNILQGYGQTEASPLISANRPGTIRIETVGPAVDGVDVKLADDGELLARGACLMSGYWRNDEATAETLQGGWLHTGDLASIDNDGYITITGRKKEMIVNSGGDNIAPSRVEAEFAIEPEIGQIMVYGDKRPYLVALIVPSEDIKPLSADAQKSQIFAAISRVNKRLSAFERIRHFSLIEESFTIENKMMTNTLKIRRHVILATYEDKLAQLYER